MCGRVYLKTNLEGLLRAFAFAKRDGAEGLANQMPRFNGAPSQYYPVIIRDVIRDDGVMGPVFITARWGLIPGWIKERKPGQPAPINAKAETIATNGMFRGAYKSRRCLVPIDGFFEWKDIHGTGKNKQPYAIAMKSGQPFVLAGIWETWRDPVTDEDIRTFCVVTCEPNELMATIHDRMPVILHPEDYDRWISPEPEAADLMKPFPAELMTMWKIGSKVGSPRNDSADILDPVD